MVDTAKPTLTPTKASVAVTSVAVASPTITKPATTKPATAKPATSTVAARKPLGSDWRTYGPMQVDWANWQTMGGSFVAPSLGSDGKPHYLAINCGARKLNATSQSGQWKTWDAPQTDFEQQLVSDLCKSKGT